MTNSIAVRIRFATLLVGLWIGMSLAMWVVATTNFKTVDAILAPGYRTELVATIAPRSLGEERPILRFLASELNRRYFAWWSYLQVAFGGLMLALVWRIGVRFQVAAVALLAIVLAILVWLTPAMLERGPPLDFVPRPFSDAWRDAGEAFMFRHHLYSSLDLLKMAILLGVAAGLVRDHSVAAGRPTA